MPPTANNELRDVIAALPPEWSTPTPSYDGVLRASGVQPNPDCPRHYLYTARLRWMCASKSIARSAGSLSHRFFAGLYGGMTLPQVTDTLATALAPIIDNATDDYARKDIMKAWNIARVMATHWVKTYGHPAEHKEQPLAIEQTIQKSLDCISPRATLVGTIDLVVKDKESELVWIVDHKTVSIAPSLWAQGLTFDTQPRMYRELWDSAHPESPAVGVIHNIIMRPGIIQKKNQTFDEYVAEVGDWYELRMAETPGMAPLMRSYVRFNEPPLKDNPELLTTLESAATWARKDAHLDSFPRNRKCCTNFKRVCPYIDLCNSNCKMWPGILTTPGRFTHAEAPIDAALKGHPAIEDGLAEDF